MREITGKCFKCGEPVRLGIDGVWEDKECCWECFVKYFRDKGKEKADA